MEANQSYAEWVALFVKLQKTVNSVARVKHAITSYTDEQIRDLLIQKTLHAEVRWQCLIDPETTLEEVIWKGELYIRTSNTD